ncbi:uncharacterized protein VNE69_02035 [Vairimorpha necatrix]|uniref:Uncharacterized protein n=1 Tax=Vairimorpha necatrix TaxID=6039 RepID=A0AAX4J978_9MICR
MLQYILFDISFTIETNENNLWRGWEDQSKLNFDELQLIKNNDNNVKENLLNQIYSSYRRRNEKFNATSRKKPKSKILLGLLKNFNNIKYYNHKYNDISENVDHYKSRKICFDSLFRRWKNENFDIKEISNARKFNKEESKKYLENSCSCNRWSRKYSAILKKYLPKIKKEIANLSADEIYKQSTIKTIDSISNAMAYFEKIHPKSFNYKKRYDEMVNNYRLIIYRLPYLFDYFDLVGKFIKLYEMLIEQCIEESPAYNNMTIILFEMSKQIINITILRGEYLERIKNKLRLLENLK